LKSSTIKRVSFQRRCLWKLNGIAIWIKLSLSCGMDRWRLSPGFAAAENPICCEICFGIICWVMECRRITFCPLSLIWHGTFASANPWSLQRLSGRWWTAKTSNSIFSWTRFKCPTKYRIPTTQTGRRSPFTTRWTTSNPCPIWTSMLPAATQGCCPLTSSPSFGGAVMRSVCIPSALRNTILLWVGIRARLLTTTPSTAVCRWSCPVLPMQQKCPI